MAFARHAVPVVGIGPFRTSNLRWVILIAAAVSAFCGAAAFLVLVLRDHNRPKVMVNEQSAPALAHGRTGSAAAPGIASAPPGPAKKPSDPGSKPRTEFNLSTSDRAATLGPAKLRLIRTDPARQIYDINVIVGRRSFSHRRLKVNQPLWIAANRGSGSIEMVVSSIQNGSVTGYWSPSDRRARVSPRNRSKRR